MTTYRYKGQTKDSPNPSPDSRLDITDQFSLNPRIPSSNP